MGRRRSIPGPFLDADEGTPTGHEIGRLAVDLNILEHGNGLSFESGCDGDREGRRGRVLSRRMTLRQLGLRVNDLDREGVGAYHRCFARDHTCCPLQFESGGKRIRSRSQ